MPISLTTVSGTVAFEDLPTADLTLETIYLSTELPGRATLASRLMLLCAQTLGTAPASQR